MADITADTVSVIFEADDSRYLRKLDNNSAQFMRNMRRISKAAQDAGAATAVSFDKVTGTFTRSADATDKALARMSNSLNKIVADGVKTSGSMRSMGGNIANVGSQFNDIAVQLASGTSPWTIALQQGTQLNQVFASMKGAGGVGVLKLLADGLMSMVSPISLATIGIIALGGYAIQWLTSMKSELPKVSDYLKEHGELVKDIKDYYEGAESSAEKYGKTAGIVLDSLIRKQAETAKKLADRQNAEFLNPLSLSGAITGSGEFVVAPEFQAAAPAIVKFREELKKGNADFDAFIESVQNSELSQKLKDDLITGANALRELNAAADTKPLTDYQKAMADVNAAIQAMDDKKVQDALEEIAKKAGDGKITVDQVGEALRELSILHPDMAGPIGAMNALILKAQEANTAISGIGGRVGSMNAPMTIPEGQARPLGGLEFGSRFGDDNDAATRLAEQKAKIEKEQKQLAEAAERARLKAERDAKRKSRESTREDDYERFNRRIQEQMEVAEQEYNAQAKINPLVEDYGFALEAARLYQEGLNAAKKAGVDLSPAEQEALRKQTEGLAAIRAEQERLNEEQAKVKQNFEEWNGVAKDAVGGFISDLQNGVSLADALHNALDKVLDKLIEVGLNSIFDPQSGIFGGGGGGGLGAIFGGLFGGFRANGGPVGVGKSYVVGEKGPEIFTPDQSGSIIPNSAKLTGGATTTSGPQAVDVHFINDVDDNGNITPIITRIAQREVGAGMKRVQKTEIQRLPGNMQAVRQRGLAR